MSGEKVLGKLILNVAANAKKKIDKAFLSDSPENKIPSLL